MYTKLKQDARAAGYPISEGDDLTQTDMQPVRDFLFHIGSNIGENFTQYNPGTEPTPENDDDFSEDGETVEDSSDQTSQTSVEVLGETAQNGDLSQEVGEKQETADVTNADVTNADVITDDKPV